MKCDKLQYERLGEANWAYPASTLVIRKQFVDEAVAELKDIAENACLECDDNQTAIDELEDENRKLKRALWMARADRAKAIQWHEGLDRYLQERKNYWPSRFCFMANDEMYHVWYKCWCEVERKCRAKAEEYR